MKKLIEKSEIDIIRKLNSNNQSMEKEIRQTLEEFNNLFGQYDHYCGKCSGSVTEGVHKNKDNKIAHEFTPKIDLTDLEGCYFFIEGTQYGIHDYQIVEIYHDSNDYFTKIEDLKRWKLIDFVENRILDKIIEELIKRLTNRGQEYKTCIENLKNIKELLK